MIYLLDHQRHLVCVPYSVEGLHRMAVDLGIGRHWFHGGGRPHYDCPKGRFLELLADPRVRAVRPRVVLAVVDNWARSLENQDKSAVLALDGAPLVVVGRD